MSNNTDPMPDNRSSPLDSFPGGVEPRQAPRLLDQVRKRLRVKLQLAYGNGLCGRDQRYMIFHGKQHPAAKGKAEIEAFLTHLAAERNVAVAMQGQALAVKYPHAPTAQAWQYIFASSGFSTDPRSGALRQHPVDEKREKPQGLELHQND